MMTIYIQWQRLDTRRFEGGQIKRFRYDSPVAAAEAIKRFTSVSWCRVVSGKNLPASESVREVSDAKS